MRQRLCRTGATEGNWAVNSSRASRSIAEQCAWLGDTVPYGSPRNRSCFLSLKRHVERIVTTNKDKQLELYRLVLAQRILEATIAETFEKALLPKWSHLYIGQEAVAAGVCAALRKTDYITSTHRGHGHLIAKGGSPKEIICEIAGRAPGYCRGKGGTMHIASAGLGDLGAISIVAGGIPVAVGAGLSARMQGMDRVVACFFGDGAANQGTFHEGLNMASLWQLPVVFVCENNLYAFSTPQQRSMVLEDIADRACAYGMPGVVVDGNDARAVYTAAKEAVQRARAGEGPTLIECKTYRHGGHSTAHSELIGRSKQELEAWKSNDPVDRFRKVLLEEGILTEEEDQRIRQGLEAGAQEALEYALAAPLPKPEELFEDVFAAPYPADEGLAREPSTLMSYSEAIREALREEMERDPGVFIMGEDEKELGGTFGVTKGLVELFGEERVRDTPISENAMVGAGIGAALTGMRPVVDIMFMDLMGLCSDQLVNLAAKIRYMTGGQVALPLVVRTPCGGGFSAGATHSQSLEAWFYHVPGLKVVMPSTPYDAKGLLKTAIREDNPVLFIEHKGLYGTKGMVPRGDYTIPLGNADVKRVGDHVTVIATSKMVMTALGAAETLSKEGIELEVVDPRTLVPLDMETMLDSFRKTGRLVIAEEAVKRGSVGADFCSRIVEEAFDYLDGPIVRLGAPSVPFPFSPALEQHMIPTEEDVVNAVRRVLAWGGL